MKGASSCSRSRSDEAIEMSIVRRLFPICVGALFAFFLPEAGGADTVSAVKLGTFERISGNSSPVQRTKDANGNDEVTKSRGELLSFDVFDRIRTLRARAL